jgi:hypothetical protein
MSGDRHQLRTKKGLLIVFVNLATGLILIGLFQNCGSLDGSSGFMTLASNTPTTTSLPSPIISSSSSSVMFKETIASKDKDSQQLILTNSGDVKVQFDSMAITGGDSGDFRIENENCLSSSPLLPGASCQVNLEFKPLSPASRHSALAVVIADQTETLTILLNGTGLVDPATIFGRNDVCYNTATCNTSGPGVHTPYISRSEAGANCATNMEANPNTQITCCFDGVPYRTQNMTLSNNGRSDICFDSEACNTSGNGVHTAAISRPDAEASCNINIANNPTTKISCCFNGLIYKTANVTTLGRSDISYGTQSCSTSGTGLHTASIDRSSAEEACDTNMAANPNSEVTCCFNGVSYKYQPAETQGRSDVVFGTSTCSTSGQGVHTASISRSMAEVSCAENIANNPSTKITCCFNGSSYRTSN